VTGPAPSPISDILHASSVAIARRAVLITGASGQGKSRLALDLVSRGAVLIADDRTVLTRRGDAVIAASPDTIRGGIEARGVGLLRAPASEPCALACVVDMDREETERLPPDRETEVLGVTLPLLRHSVMTCFPAALILYLTHGRFA